MENKKRLFFGLEVHSPWPENMGPGKIIQVSNRHVTLAFLGEIDPSKLESHMTSIPLPPFNSGLTGIFDKCLFLPHRHPRLVAWEINWLTHQRVLEHYVKALHIWLENHEFFMKKEESFLSHVTICRRPSHYSHWRNSFTVLPLYISHLHLYESLGNSEYKSRWTYSLPIPFEELDHTADIAYSIKGENYNELYIHALIALAFKYPLLLNFFEDKAQINDLDDVIIALNQIITKADASEGCPLKAISFHGKLEEIDQGIKKWEMVVDV